MTGGYIIVRYIQFHDINNAGLNDFNTLSFLDAVFFSSTVYHGPK